MAVHIANIRQGACYSNGEFGQKWTVWQVTEIRIEPGDSASGSAQHVVHFRVLVGKNRRKYKSLALEDFSNKVRYEVELVESTWQRIK